MKRLYILLFSATFFLSNQAVSQDFISVSDVPSTLCANESLTIYYSLTAAYTGTIEIQLSDALGSFVAPTVLVSGTVSSETEGYAYITIPATIPLSGTSTYRIRAYNNGSYAENPSSNIVINCTTRDYYWLGGAGNWSDLSHWEWTTDDVTFTPATEPPTANDNVNFDGSTFPSGGQLTVDVEAFCNDFYWDPASGVNNPVLWSDSNPLNVYGDFEMAPGVYRDIRYLYFQSIKYNVYLDFADNLMQYDPNSTWYETQIYFYSNGSWDLYSDLVAYRFDQYNGTFYTNDYTLDLGYRFYNTGTFYAGASNIWSRGFTIYGTYDTGTSTLFPRPNKYGSVLWIDGNQTHNNVTINNNICRITDSNTFNNLSLVNGGGMSLNGGTIQTINNSFNAQGAGRSQMAVINSLSPGVQGTIAISGGASILAAEYVSITDNNLTGATQLATNAIDGGGNSVSWIFSSLTPLEYYWVGGSGNWSDAANHWATSDGGSTLHPEGPSAIDNVNFTSNSFPSSGAIVTIDQPTTIKDMIWTTGSGANSPEIYAESTNKMTIMGDLTLDTGVRRSINDLTLDSSQGIINVSLADNLGNHGNLRLIGGGIINLLSEFKNVNGWFYISDVAFNSNGNDVTFWGMQINSDLANVNWGNSNLYMDYYLSKNNLATVDYGTSTLYIQRPNQDWESPIYGQHNFYNVETTNRAEFHDINTFNSLTVSAGGTLALSSGNTQTTAALFLNGSRSSLAKIRTFDTGNGPINSILEWTTSVTADYVDISDNTITPALASPILGLVATPNNNIGWNITPLPPLDFRWIGGTGNWSDLAHWEESGDGGSSWAAASSTPGSIDNVFFTTNSFPSGGTCTIDQITTINSMTWETGSGANSPEIATTSWNESLTILGNMTMADGVNRSIQNLYFDSSSGTNTIDLADNTNAWGNITFLGGGIWDLASDLSAGGNCVNINEGTLNTNNYSLTFGCGYIANDLSVLNLGNSNIYVSSNLNIDATTATINVGTSTFYFYHEWNTVQISGNPMTFYNVNIDGVVRIQSDNTYNSLTVNQGAALRLFAGSTQTVTGALTLVGTRNSFVTVESWDNGSPANGNFDVTGATVVADFVDISDNTVTPASTITSGINGGGNIGWTIGPLPALDFFWINGTGNWSDLSHWQTSDDGGATFTAATGTPGPVDNVFFTSSSFPVNNGRVEIDQPIVLNDMTWQPGSGANNPEIYANWDNSVRIKGDLTMDDGVYRRMYRLYFDSSSGENNLNFADNLESNGDVWFQGGGIVNLLSDMSRIYTLWIEDVTLNTNDNSILASSMNINSDQSITNWGNSTIYVEGSLGMNPLATVNASTSTFVFGNNYGNFNLYGPITLNNIEIIGLSRMHDNNQFNNVTINPGGKMHIQAGTTQTIINSLNVIGTRSALAEIDAFDGGTGTLVVGAGVTADYVAIGNNVISPAASATNAIDNGNNTGWTLSPLTALDLYWIGGSGNWTDATHWSYTDGGASNIDGFAPGALDNAIFTTNSFPSVGQVTIDVPITVNDLTWLPGSGTNSPEIFADWGNRVTIMGDFIMDDNVSRRIYEMTFNSSNGINNIDMADNKNGVGYITMSGGGQWNLLGDFKTDWDVYVGDGTLNTNNHSLTASYYSTDNQAILNWGNSDVFIRYYFDNYATPSNFNAGGSTFYFGSPNYNYTYLRGNPAAFNAVVIDATIEIESDNTYNSFTAEPSAIVKLFAGSTQTINNGGTLNLTGTRSGFINLESFDYGSPGRGIFNVTGVTTLIADYIRIKDNIIDNGLAANVMATNAVNLGNNIGWDYTPISSLDYYWINGAGNWTDISHWQTSPDGGTTFEAATDPPGEVDNVFFTSTSFPEGGALTFDKNPEIYNMTWELGSGANFPVLQEFESNNELIIHGSLQMANGVTRNFYRLKFESDDTGNTISMADNLYGWQDIDFSGTGEWTLLDSMATSYLNIRGGTLNTNDQAISVQQQIYLDWQHNGTINWGSSNVYLRSIYFDAQNLTFNAQNSTFNFNGVNGNASLRGGYPMPFNDVIFRGKANLENFFSFNNFTLLAGTELVLNPSSTQTVTSSFTAIGSRGEMIQISSGVAGTPATLAINTIGGASLTVEYVIFKDNILDNGDADPSTQEIAASSVDNGGNQGWDFLTSPLAPLNYYWVGGTGNWSDISHWATEDNGTTKHVAPPGVIDNVFFTSNSFPTSGTITLDQPAGCNDMTWSDGSFSPTIYGNYENRLTIRGNLSIANGVNRNLEYIEFSSDKANLLILGNNRYNTYSEFIFRGTGSWSLIDSLSASSISLYSGTLNTLDNPINLLDQFTIGNEGPITVNFGSSKITTRSIGNYAWSGNVTADIGTSHIYMKSNGYFDGDPMEFYDVTIEGNTQIYPELTVTNNLTILPGAVLEMSPNNTFTVGNLIAAGTRPLPVTIRSWSPGNQATISSAGSITASDIVIRDSNATGGALFNATEAIDKGNNSGWNFTPITPIDFYWTGGSGDWSDITHWSTSPDGGSTFAPATFGPGAVDDVTIDALLTGPATINLDNPAECNNMVWESGLSGSAISGDNQSPFTVHGSLILSSGVSTELENLIFDSELSGNTIDLADNIGNQFITMQFKGSGDWTLTDSLATYYLYLEGGTLNTNGNPLSAQYLGLYGNGATELNLGSSNVYVSTFDGSSTNTTLTPGTSTLYLEENSQVYNSWTFNNIDISGEATFYENNTINELTLLPGSTLIIDKSDTLTVSKLFANGLRSRPISIKSTETGTRSTILQSSGSVNATYVTLQDNNATGGAFFIAQSSIDNGNNLGWTIIQTSARNYYWVGGSGKWSEFIGHWSNSDGGDQFFDSSPGPLDNVFFTSSSFPSGGTLTIDFPVSVNDMNWTGSTTSVSITDLGEFENSITVGGDFILANGVSRDFEDLFLTSNKTGNTIYTADNLSSRNYMQFTGTGEWSLAGPLNTYYIWLAAGTFNTNDYNVDATLINLLYDNTSNWGSSQVTTRRFYTQNLNSSSTFKSGNSTFIFDQQSLIRGTNRFFNVQVNSDATFYNSNIIINAEVHNGTLSLNENQAFSNLVITDGATLSLAPGTIQTVNLGLNIIGSQESPVTINSTSEGERGFFTVPSSGSVNATYAHIKDNTANSGGALFNTTNSSDFGNVNGWLGLLQGQVIFFDALDDQSLASGGMAVNASSSSGLNIAFEIANGNATISGNSITPTTSGLVGIRAVQAGNTTYGSAKPLTQYMHFDATNTPEELGNMKQARIAIGQPNPFTAGSFYSNSTTPSPWSAAISSTGKLAIANGTRVLIWNQIPSSYDVPADIVVGHNDFTTDYNPTVSASNFYQEVTSVNFTRDDKMIVTDSRGILIFNSIPTLNGASADVIVGQTNFTGTRSGTTNDRFADLVTATIYYDEVSATESLIVTDFGNSRVLIFNTIPVTNGASADIVIGQSNFNSKTVGAAANQLSSPVSTTAKNGKLLIADYGNHRVVVYNSIPTSNGASANFVLGQPGFGFNEPGTSATLFRNPTGVSISRLGKLAVADYVNNRVLIYNSMPTSTTAAPDIILGQPNATSRDLNYNAISGRTMANPISVTWDISNNLFVADIANNRVLLYGAPDLNGPVIESSTIPASHLVGSGTAGSLTVTDRSGVNVIMHHRGLSSSDPTSQTTPLSDDGNGNFNFNTNDFYPSGEELGIEYGLEIVDGYGNTQPIVTETIPLLHNGGLPITKFGVGSEATNYRLFSVPLELSSKDVKTVFDEIISGTYDNSKLRVYSYPGGNSGNYTELSGGNTNIELGKGYIALSAASASVSSGTGLTADVGTATPFETTLVSGWNMIGNPYNFNVSWADILAESAISGTQPETPQAYTGQWGDITAIAAGSGVFVNNPTTGNMIIKFPVVKGAGGRIAGIEQNTNSLLDDNWEVRLLEATADGSELLLGAIGMDEVSEFSYDEMDRINPPPFSEQARVEFPHPEFFQPSFKKDIRASNYEEKWEFNYTAPSKDEERTIHWDNSYFGESAPDLYLVDKSHFKVINMKEENSYTFVHGNETKFELYFGYDAYEALRPDKLTSITPYPNPFSEQVQINVGLPNYEKDSKVIVAIYNTLGIQVASLDTYVNDQAYLQFVWNGLNDSGHEVPDGIYAFRVLIDGNLNEYVAGKVIKE